MCKSQLWLHAYFEYEYRFTEYEYDFHPILLVLSIAVLVLARSLQITYGRNFTGTLRITRPSEDIIERSEQE